MSPARFAEEATRYQAHPWVCPPHIELMNEVALKVAAGIVTRHMTLEPPQTGKSEFWSRWVIAWLLGKFPDRRVILGSYNSEYASSWGRAVRDTLEEFGDEYFGVRVRPDHYAENDFGLVGHRGGLRTMGMDAGITGKPADHFFIDDFMKGPVEAESPTMREKHWRIYHSCVETRIQPGGTICLTFTPWHEDDLGGRLLRAEPGLYSVLRLPALAEEPVPEAERAAREGYLRLVGAPDPLGRPPGRALWPDRYDEAHYERKRRAEPHYFDALYQCSPHAREGGMFRREWFEGRMVDAVPAAAARVRYWDKAASRDRGDYTVGVLMACRGDEAYVEDVVRERLEPAERDAMIRRVCDRDNRLYPGRVVTWGEHAGNDAKESATNFILNLRGFAAFTEGTGNRDKVTRAYPFASWCQAGKVSIRRAHWNEAFLHELTTFTGSGRGHDDQVDAASGAFGKLALGAAPGGYASLDDEEYGRLVLEGAA